jgi:hypothetical protein
MHSRTDVQDRPKFVIHRLIVCDFHKRPTLQRLNSHPFLVRLHFRIGLCTRRMVRKRAANRLQPLIVASEAGLLLDFPCGNDTCLSSQGSHRTRNRAVPSGAKTRSLGPEMIWRPTSGSHNCFEHDEECRKRRHSPSSEIESSVDSVGVVVVGVVVGVALSF